MTRFSVIIPVYNSEAYLDECLSSVESQTYGDFEAVCVDDGSSDASRAIIERHAAQDGRIRLVAKENGGPSSARNAGLRTAQGDVVLFLDCDDALEECALDRLASLFETHDIDAVVFGWSCFGGKPDRWIAECSKVPDALYPSFAPALLLDEPTLPFLRVAVRRSLLDENGIAFDEELYLGEDAAFLMGLYPHAAGVKLVSDKLYRYRLPHDGSIMQSIAGDVAEESLQGVNAVISIYGRWAQDGFLERYPETLVEWTVRYSLYTVLRRDEPLRSELCSLLRELWLAHFSEDELRALDIPRHAKRLVNHALDQDTASLSRDLLAYRLAEYGPVDLALALLKKLRHS